MQDEFQTCMCTALDIDADCTVLTLSLSLYLHAWQVKTGGTLCVLTPFSALIFRTLSRAERQPSFACDAFLCCVVCARRLRTFVFMPSDHDVRAYYVMRDI